VRASPSAGFVFHTGWLAEKRWKAGHRLLAQVRQKRVRPVSPPEKPAVARRWIDVFKSPCPEPDKKLLWLKVIIPAALICSLGLSRKLWLSSRLFPLTPVSSVLPTIPSPVDLIWLVLLLELLLAIIVVRAPRKLIFSFLVFAGLLSLWDQTRWQPWFYQYFLMLAAIGLYAWKKSDMADQQALNACRMMIGLIYFWSGLQKLNVNFITQTWPDMAGPFLRLLLPEALRKIPPVIILVIPLLEIVLGIGLITRKYRNFFVVFAIAMHLFILAVLAASGENKVVWPWNLAMALFAVVLFWQDNETSFRRILIPRGAFHALVLFLFGILPIFSFFDLWDSYLAAALYSGNTDQAIVLVSHAEIDHLPKYIHQYAREGSYWFFLDVNRWAYGELNVPVYPEPRIYRSVARQICTYGKNPSETKLMIRKKPNPFNGHREDEFYDCDHLL